MSLIGLSFSASSLAFLETVPHKFRAQIIKKARALILDSHPNGAKQLKGITTAFGEPIIRERSGDYRILYVLRSDPIRIVILDIDNRKDVYK